MKSTKMSENMMMPLTTQKELIENHIVFQDSKPVSHPHKEYTSTWYPKAVYIFSSILDTCLMKNVDLIVIDVCTAMTFKILDWLQDFITILDIEKHIKKERILDASMIRPGDILLTSDHKHVIVKYVHAIKSDQSPNRVSLEVVHALNYLLVSKRVVKSTFAFSPQEPIIRVCEKSQREREIVRPSVDAAVRLVGQILLLRSKYHYWLLPNSWDLFAVRMSQRKFDTIKNVKPGDIILFTYHGLYQKGLITSKSSAQNNILQVQLYYTDNDGTVSETFSSYNLDSTQIIRYAYNDLDSVMRKRLLFTAEQMKGNCLFKRSIFKSLKFVLGCMSGDFLLKLKTYCDLHWF